MNLFPPIWSEGLCLGLLSGNVKHNAGEQKKHKPRRQGRKRQPPLWKEREGPMSQSVLAL